MVDAADGGMAVHTRWSISRGRSLNPQLHPRMLALKLAFKELHVEPCVARRFRLPDGEMVLK